MNDEICYFMQHIISVPIPKTTLNFRVAAIVGNQAC